MSTAIIYFVKLPIIGYNKTRLQGFLPKEDIHHLSIHLLQETYKEICKVDADIYLFVSPSDQKKAIQKYLEIKSDKIFGQLDSSHLGERMSRAMQQIFNRGYDKVLLLGCDLVDIKQSLIEQVIKMLDHEDVVLAPTLDGGYGIIASRQFSKSLFDLENYSHDEVCQRTINKLSEAKLSYALTETIRDLDTREDVVRYLSGDPHAVYFNQGEYNANFLIDKGRKIFRIALGSQMNLDNQIEYEYLALKGLASSGVVPKVYQCQPHTDLLGKGYLIEEYLPGHSLDYHKDLSIAANILARIHSVDIDTIPHLIKAKYPFQLMYQEFIEMYNHYQNWKGRDLEVINLIDALMISLKKYSLSSELSNPCVINTELNSHNFLINSHGDSYLIDWEKPLIGEREQDIAHFLAPTTTLWKTDYLLSYDEISFFIKEYDKSSQVKINKDKLKQYLHFTCLRGITWCSMAYVQYLESQKVKANDQSFQTISRFISPIFLQEIKEYIEKLEGVNL
ncbi:TIGR04282 family arsenosugar biosynthesis glycosyltransferase [Facklamia sp. 7083-14-GEN3]|uniref:TIGR04282 family arsenosugar biosynthesis glycosyltransferase n=1 Tax=Facklamia sp. 7083-14-GEN3 TaxID=2973478 RepID=UPI00215CD2A2|nr:TIGR04282 family arsenosugar biosynthesis glycosyltransferase [Facklamia sp. 7083-14-GEN3]MCR8968568.1 TIGR04282 family arsenosugar biosynthesis glycosyltransferase [Facklamia sp. 7083-14-GEN3]